MVSYKCIIDISQKVGVNHMIYELKSRCILSEKETHSKHSDTNNNPLLQNKFCVCAQFEKCCTIYSKIIKNLFLLNLK